MGKGRCRRGVVEENFDLVGEVLHGNVSSTAFKMKSDGWNGGRRRTRRSTRRPPLGRERSDGQEEGEYALS